MVILEEPPRVQQRTGVAAAPLPGRETKSLAFPPWQECLCHAKEVTDRPSAASRWTPVTGRCDHRAGTLSCQTAGKRQKLETERSHGALTPSRAKGRDPNKNSGHAAQQSFPASEHTRHWECSTT